MGKKQQKTTEHVESRRLVEVSFELARSINIRTLLVQADELRDIRFVERLREAERIIWLTRGDVKLPFSEGANEPVVTIPDVALTRMSQLKIGLLLAIMNEYVSTDETIVCLSGVAGSKRLDTMLIANPERDFPWLRGYDVGQIQGNVAPRGLVKTLDVALRLAREGREGRAVGTAFVLGDTQQLLPYLRQLVLNPCQGHTQRERNIHDDRFFETLREFAALDGAFVLNNRGIVVSAGTYLDAPPQKGKLPSGLGARHAASAAITGATDAVAIVVSESSGTVTMFHKGQAVLELEKSPG